MSSILKVDQIQLANGNTPTAGDLGLNTTGNVLQVKQAFKTDTGTGASSSFADISGMSVTITPSSASSKFLITFHAAITMYDNTIQVRLMRDSTAIGLGDGAGSRVRTTAGQMQTTPTKITSSQNCSLVYRHRTLR